MRPLQKAQQQGTEMPEYVKSVLRRHALEE